MDRCGELPLAQKYYRTRQRGGKPWRHSVERAPKLRLFHVEQLAFATRGTISCSEGEKCVSSRILRIFRQWLGLFLPGISMQCASAEIRHMHPHMQKPRCHRGTRTPEARLRPGPLPWLELCQVSRNY